MNVTLTTFLKEHRPSSGITTIVTEEILHQIPEWFDCGSIRLVTLNAWHEHEKGETHIRCKVEVV